MSPNIVGEQTMEELRKAVTPGDADVGVAKATLRSLLSSSAATTTTLIDEVLASLNVTPSTRDEHYDIRPELEPGHAVDSEAMPLKRARMTYATKLAIAELVAEGVIVPAKTPGNDYIQVAVHRSGTSGAERVPVSTPNLDGAYRAKPRSGPLGEAPALDASAFTQGLGSILTPRAVECLEEALAAYRRGLYLSAVNLLGAVSEAAWYQVAAGLESENSELGSALAASRTGEIQRLVAKVFHDRSRRARSMSNELVAHASYLRDLRNYGVHPAADQDPGQAHAFTEPGCTVLVMQTHRYLARLREAAELVGLDFS